MPTSADPRETAWDRLLDLIDHLAGAPDNRLPDDLENQFAGLIEAHRSVRTAHPEIAADDDLAVLRVIVTRWLHPVRANR